MSEHTPTPWMTNRAGEMLPDDWMIVADMGKTPNGIQQISTVARALSIRQTPETTAANAAFIVNAVNNHERLIETLQEARLQIEYLHERFKPTGTSEAVLARINHVLTDLISLGHT